MRKIFRILILLSLICFLMNSNFMKDIDARPFSEHKPAGKAGLVAGSALSSAAYFPLKLVYAAVGGITSGLTYGMSLGKESELANKIAVSSFYGDWYIHPNILTGEEKLDFNGPDDVSP